MNNSLSNIDAPAGATESIASHHPAVRLGQWYWVVKAEGGSQRDQPSPNVASFENASALTLADSLDELLEPDGDTVDRWLGCVIGIGSNYLLLSSAPSKSGYQSTRVHFRDFWTRLIAEPRADEVINGRAQKARERSAQVLARIQEVTRQIGMGSGTQPTAAGGGNALMVMSSETNVDHYKRSLVSAKNDVLPGLFEEAKRYNELAVQWMSAQALPLKAMAGDMKDLISEIDSRLSSLSLYAGFSEEVHLVRDGAPAGMDSKLHVMQQRLYMDEECLINYQSGGMEFRNVREFDSWLSQEENLNEILPFARCMVAMKVRRSGKNRSHDGYASTMFVNIRLSELDHSTFLYIRNGERLYRLNTDVDFGEKIFPDRTEFDPSEPLAFKYSYSRVEDFITMSDLESRKEEHARLSALASQWEQENCDEPGNGGSHISFKNPYRHELDLLRDINSWIPFNQDSVYYDEAAKAISNRIQSYNRIAVVIQGLFDRSDVLHPHAGAKIWTPDGFAKAINLIYDGSDALHCGEVPDFEAYRARLNSSIQVGSIISGAHQAWTIKEAEIANEKDHRVNYVTYEPHGNPGPGYVCIVRSVKPRAKQVTVQWVRERFIGTGYYRDDYTPIPCSLTLPFEKILNVSAYTSGDYRIFMRDRRSRAQYLMWAPLLLAAEEYHNGKLAPDPTPNDAQLRF